MITTEAAIAHLRTVKVVGQWVTPTDDDMYFTVGHPLLADEDYGEVDYILDRGWVATVYLDSGKQEFDVADSTWGKIKVEEVLREAGALILFPTEP